MAQVASDVTLDCSGLVCPMPIVRLSKAITRLRPGQVIEIIATDPGSKEDVPAFCQRTKHTLVASREEGGRFIFYVRSGP
jgi:tRNA 2-thiouridine synthesizing protein A